MTSAFQIFRPGLDQSYGIAAYSPKVLGDSRIDKYHNSNNEKSVAIVKTIYIVVISAIVFLTVISLYDVVRNIISNYFTRIALADINSGFTDQEVRRVTVAGRYSTVGSVVFFLVVLLSAAIAVPLLVWLSRETEKALRGSEPGEPKT